MALPKLMTDGSGELPALETVCRECAGEGKIPTQREGRVIVQGGICSRCNGNRTVPTEDGRRLLSFLHRNAMAA